MDLDSLERTAVRAAYRSSEVLRARYGKLSAIDKKGPTDLVTDADFASETEIVATIRTAFPDHAIVAEESGIHDGSAEWRWLVDPLDGTVNYAHQVPFFAVSIACVQGDEARLGVVLNPVSGELFTAQAGGGARLNGQPIHVGPETRVSESLLATGFPYDIRDSPVNNLDHFQNFCLRAQAVRRCGSAALDLCYLACGRFDGFWELKLKPWDVAAGALIVTEAGGRVSDLDGGDHRIDNGETLATNGLIHEAMLEVIKLGRREPRPVGAKGEGR